MEAIQSPFVVSNDDLLQSRPIAGVTQTQHIPINLHFKWHQFRFGFIVYGADYTERDRKNKEKLKIIK